MSGGVVDLANAGFDELNEDELTVREYLRTKEQLANAIAERNAWRRESAMLLAACEEALWHTDGYEDVDDGSDGPVPNVFMKIASGLREAIAKATKA